MLLMIGALTVVLGEDDARKTDSGWIWPARSCMAYYVGVW